MPKRPASFFDLIQPAVDVVISNARAKLLTDLRKRPVTFSIAPVVWQRMSDGLSNWQRSRITGALQADFKSMGAIPYVKLNAAEAKELVASLGTLASVRAFDKSVASKKKKSRNDTQAVSYYKKKILQVSHGEAWLRARQPRWMTVVDRTLELYTQSMDLCLARIDTDRDYVARCFLDGNAIQSLVDVIITDSDAHKGGKRVLFLDFSFRSGRTKQTRRVVYKPSDVEIDYRIAGKNTAAITTLFTEESASGAFPQPHESFFELLDRLELGAANTKLASAWSSSPAKRNRLKALLSLPTYVILPRNPGSRLRVDRKTGWLPIDTSYGYLEYLPFQPKAPELGAVFSSDALPLVVSYVKNRSRWRWDARASKTALDWIVSDPDLAKPAFRLWGRLMSIACVLLQTDLHHQNQRLQGLKPHVIDLENCMVKTCPTPGGPAGTMIPESLRKVAAAGSRTLTEATNNQLYLRSSGLRASARWLSALDPGASLQVKEGIRDALAAMTAIREEIANWAQASMLASVIVRHVVIATGDLETGMSLFNQQLMSPANANKTRDEVLREFMSERRDMAVAVWRRATSPYVKEDNPSYGLEIPEYNGKDFVDRNVPTYYRRAASLDLLTWWGETVVYKKQPGDSDDLAFAHYHQHKGLDLLKASFTDKLPKDAASLEKTVNAFIASAFDTKPAFRRGAA